MYYILSNHYFIAMTPIDIIDIIGSLDNKYSMSSHYGVCNPVLKEIAIYIVDVLCQHNLGWLLKMLSIGS